jgi:hypothetical protein
MIDTLHTEQRLKINLHGMVEHVTIKDHDPENDMLWCERAPGKSPRMCAVSYLSLDDLFASVKGRAERSRTRTVESAAIRVEAHRDNPEKLGLVLPGADEPIAPTHWSLCQRSSLVGAPAAYLRQFPAPLVGINLQYGLTNHRAEQIKTMEVANGCTELRAVTGPDYGRIYDHELVSAVQRIAGNGTGGTRWTPCHSAWARSAVPSRASSSADAWAKPSSLRVRS